MAAGKNRENSTNRLVVFQDKKIRRVFHNGEWYFSIIDVIDVLTESTYANRYWSDVKIQLAEKEGFFQVYEKIVRLKLEAPDGKMRETDTTNTETLFRIIQMKKNRCSKPYAPINKSNDGSIMRLCRHFFYPAYHAYPVNHVFARL
jgi:hypothetical protein